MSTLKDAAEHHMQAQNIIVIHPGSYYLRIGRASDVNPVRILHAIARRRKPGGGTHRDCVLPPVVNKNKELLQELEDCRLQITHTLQSCVQSNGQRRYATPPQQIAAFNRRSQPEVVPDSDTEWHDKDGNDVVIGEDVLLLKPDGEYNVHFPIRRGELNLHAGVGGSLFGIMSDLQTIWEHVLQTRLQIKASEMRQYRAVLVIPDIYNRAHLREYVTLLLNQIGFGCCFLVQDHVAATFGAGLGYACVVDVGDEKTSVSCVEDGISHPNTRVRFDYGGADVTQVFYWLLQKCAFPYRECNEQTPLDGVLLRRLKEDFGHVNLDVCGSVEKSFTVQHPGTTKRNYTLQVGDEAMVAPLSIFFTELLAITGANRTAPKTQKWCSLQPHPEDCFDAEYLRETGRRNKENLEQSAIDSGALTNTEAPDEDLVVDGLEQERERETKANDRDYLLPGGQLVGLDQAVIQSIERCSSDELKRKMYGCILIVGGGIKFPGIGSWLQSQLARKIPAGYRSEQSIVSSPKDMDPEITSWKGAAVMSCLESVVELWLTEHEWTRHGLRILREKAVFMW